MEMCDQRQAPAALPPTKGPAAHFTVGYVVLGARQNGCGNSGLTGFQPVASRYTVWAIPAFYGGDSKEVSPKQKPDWLLLDSPCAACIEATCD